MKLELKHLAPYLPYGLKGITLNDNNTCRLTGIGRRLGNSVDIEIQNGKGFISTTIGISNFKPILRPLSDLTKEIEHNGEKFVPLDKLTNNHRLIIEHKDIISDYLMSREQTISFTKRIEKYICFNDIVNLTNDLYSMHFDVDNLIEKGLAVDINTLNKQP